MSDGLFQSLQKMAYSHIQHFFKDLRDLKNEAIAFCSNGSLGMQAALFAPKIIPDSSPVVGAQKSNHDHFIAALHFNFLSSPFIRTLMSWMLFNPQVNSLFFSLLTEHILKSGEPFYRVREALDYLNLTERLSPQLQAYEDTLHANPDALLADFQARLSALETPESKRQRAVAFEDQGHVFRPKKSRPLNTQFSSYLKKYFPQIQFLISDECPHFLKAYLEFLSPEQGQEIIKSLQTYSSQLFQDLQRQLSREHRKEELIKNTLSKLLGLQESLEKLLPESAKTISKPTPYFTRPALTGVAKSVLKALGAMASYSIKHPVESTVVLLAMFGTRVKGQTVKSFTLNVGENFLANLYLDAGCQTSQGNGYVRCVPNLSPCYNCGFFSEFPKFIYLDAIRDQNNPNLGDEAYLGVVPNEIRFGLTAFSDCPRFLCPTPITSPENCASFLGVSFTYNLWIPNHAPYVPCTNTTATSPGTTCGLQNIAPTSASFHATPYLQAPVDPDLGDTALLKYALYILSNGNYLPFPDWMSFDKDTGSFSGVVPSGASGNYSMVTVVKDPYNGQTITNQTFQSQVQYSNFTGRFTFIAFNPPMKALRQPTNLPAAQSFTDYAFALPTSSYVDTTNPVRASLVLNGTHPNGLSFSNSEQYLYWPSPDPAYRTTGGLWLRMQWCDEPGILCRTTPGCTPPLPTCFLSDPFLIPLVNAEPAPIRGAYISPLSITIGQAATFRNTLAQFSDIERDSLRGSVVLANGDPLPPGVIFNSDNGDFSWTPPKGTPAGTYQFKFMASDASTISDALIGSVTITPRPIQIKSGLQSTLASTPMQRAGSATYPFPFRAPDLTDAQLPAFASQVDVQIPEALAPFVSVQLNTSTLSYNVSWTSIPGHGGSSPIIFTYTDPLTGQQTSTQTFLEITNAGPYKISNPVFVTGLTGTPVDYDLAAHFGHLDPDTALHFSADLPAGLELSDEGRISGTPEIPGSYKIAVSVTDDYGRTLSSASLNLTVPYAPPTVLSSHRADISVAIDPTSFTPELTGTFQTPSPDGLAQTYSLISGPPYFTVASDGSWAVNPQNGQQGNDTAFIQVRNGDQLATFSKPISIPRAALQTLSSPAFSSYIARSFSMDACTLITDPDSPGTCSNFQVSFNIPEALSPYVTRTGTVYNFNPLSGAQVQGTHPLSFRFTDKMTGQIFNISVSLTYENQAPQAQNGVSQKTVTATDESVFTTPYMEASDLDGDALDRTITGITSGCHAVDAEKQLSCTNVPAGDHAVLFSFSDPFGGQVNSTLILKISRITHAPWYINRAQDALPGIAGSFFIFFLPVFLKYRRDRRKTAGLDALYLKLPRVIGDITKRQVAYLHHRALTHESHPLGVIPLKSTAEQSQRRMPTLAAVATSAMMTPPTPSTGATSPRANSPSGLRRRVAALISAGPSGGAPNSPPQHTLTTPMIPVSLATTPAQPMNLTLSYSRQASELSVLLEDKIRKTTDHPDSISEFQTEFSLYLKALDQYHEHQGPDIVRNCNLMKLTEAIAQRLDDLIDRTKPHITDKITMMVHWLKLLYVRFVFYSSGLTTSPSIKLIDKRNLLQGLTELIKAVRSKLDSPPLLALYKELEFLRALITSVPDEDRASFWKSLPFPCIRRPDRGTATLPDDALIPKAWFLQVLAIQELSQIARIDLTALTQLNTWIESANGEGISGWIPFRKSYPRIELAIHEFLALRPLKNAKDRGEVNYWAVDAYLSILEYWNLDSTRVQSSDLNYLRTLTFAISKMFSRTFADQVSEELIKNIVFRKLQESLLTLFKKLPPEMAASCLLNFSNEFKHPIIQELLTRYLKETHTSLEEFYQELRRQYKNPERAKGIDTWLSAAPADTPGVIKLRLDILEWRTAQSGRPLAWWGTSRSLSIGTSTDAGSSAARPPMAMITNPLRSPAAQAALGAKAPSRPDPTGGSVIGSADQVVKLWKTPGGTPEGKRGVSMGP